MGGTGYYDTGLPFPHEKFCRRILSPGRVSAVLNGAWICAILRVAPASGCGRRIMTNVFEWVTQYGYLGIFSLLVAGIIGLPIPDETMLAFAGYLVFRQVLHPAPTVSAAFLGSVCGITASYTLGRTAGIGLVGKYGPYLRLTAARIDRVHQWYERIGRWTLLIGYFIPGVRHLFAVVAGTSRLRFRVFATFAYTGALVWSLTFISLGYFFGRHAADVLDRIHGDVMLLAMSALGLLLLFLLVRWLRRNHK